MVTCLECGKEKKSLAAHLRNLHMMSVLEYKTRHGQDSDIGYTISQIPRANRQPKKAVERGYKIEGAADELERSLSSSERAIYQKNYQILFEAADKDPVLEQTVKEVCINQVFVYRYQMQIQNATKKGHADPTGLEKMHRILDVLQKTNLSKLESLNLTKAKRDAHNKTPETTPARMITNLALVMSTFNATDYEKMQEDINKAMTLLEKHTEELKNLLPNEETEDTIEPIEIE